MYIGNYTIDVNLLEQAVCNSSKHRLFDVLDESAQNAYCAIDDMFRKDHIWQIRTRKKLNTLWNVLPQCLWFHCLDPRDRIFALLSLTIEGTTGRIPHLIRPDYTKIVDEVYRDATIHCLNSTQKLQCLGYATPAADEHKNCSWAMIMEQDLAWTQISWGNNASADTCALVSPQSDRNVLCLHGIHVATVGAVSAQIADPRADPELKLTAIKAFLDSAEIASLRPTSNMQQNALELSMALVAGWLPFLKRLRGDSSVSNPMFLLQSLANFFAGAKYSLNSNDINDLDHLLWWSRARRVFITNDGRGLVWDHLVSRKEIGSKVS
jgi:hypothetical protein